jgi:hypothetical protein
MMKALLCILLFTLCLSTAQAQLLEQIRAKEALSYVVDKARTDFAADAQLTHALFYGVEYQGVRLELDITTGKANGWVYRFYSTGLDVAQWFIGVKVPIIGYQAFQFNLDTLAVTVPVTFGGAALDNEWVDSDQALQGSKDGGADMFLQQHADARVLLALVLNNTLQNNFIPTGKYWLLRYGSAADTLNCLVHAQTGLAYRCIGGNAPQITSLPRTTARVGELYLYTVTAWGAPAPTFALTTSPSGMTIHAQSGEMRWTPSAGQEGPHSVTVEAVNSSGSDTQSFTINVQSSASTPRITSTPVSEAIAGKQYVYQVTTTGDPAPQYSLVQHPPGMIINASRGTINWSPLRAHAGQHAVHVRATNAGGSDDQEFTLEVYTAPIIAPISNKVTGPNLPFWYSVDVDARPAPRFTLNMGPANLTIDENSGYITWTPSDAQLGTHVVLFQASNLAGTHQQSFEITVDATVSVEAVQTPRSMEIKAIWPTPASNTAFVSLHSSYGGAMHVHAIDALGRSISLLQQQINSGPSLLHLPVENLGSGVHLLRISLNGEMTFRRIIVSR